MKDLTKELIETEKIFAIGSLSLGLISTLSATCVLSGYNYVQETIKFGYKVDELQIVKNAFLSYGLETGGYFALGLFAYLNFKAIFGNHRKGLKYN